MTRCHESALPVETLFFVSDERLIELKTVKVWRFVKSYRIFVFERNFDECDLVDFSGLKCLLRNMCMFRIACHDNTC